MSRTFQLALAQMRVDGGAAEENLARAVRFIAAAQRAGAEVVLLPEALDVGWMHRAAREQAGEIPHGATCAALIAAAKEHNVYVCSGLTERAGAQLFNSAVLIGPRGDVLLHHRKLNEL